MATKKTAPEKVVPVEKASPAKKMPLKKAALKPVIPSSAKVRNSK